jgi:hypothetical protein
MRVDELARHSIPTSVLHQKSREKSQSIFRCDDSPLCRSLNEVVDINGVCHGPHGPKATAAVVRVSRDWPRPFACSAPRSSEASYAICSRKESIVMIQWTTTQGSSTNRLGTLGPNHVERGRSSSYLPRKLSDCPFPSDMILSDWRPGRISRSTHAAASMSGRPA